MMLQFEEVPPPSKVPVQQEAERLGLLPGLRVDSDRAGGWRCAHCGTYQLNGAQLVWVPDSVNYADSAEAIREICRRSAYNGCGSGWCLSCAKKLGRRSILNRIFGQP